MFDLEDNDTLGIEIEFNGISFIEVYRYLEKLKNKNIINEDWILGKESSVQNGLEIKSPIITNKINWKKELKIICDMLKELEAKIDDTCGLHFHFGRQILEENPRILQNVILLWCYYEFDFIEKTKNDKIRRSLWYYARPISFILEDNERISLMKDYNSISDFLLDFEKNGLVFGYSLSVKNLNPNSTKKTIEIRCPASTFNHNKIIYFIEKFRLFFEDAKNMSDLDRIKCLKELNSFESFSRKDLDACDYEKIYKKKIKTIGYIKNKHF